MQKLVKVVKNKWIYLIILALFIVVPAIIQFFQVSYGDWLGFWGSYLGIIPAGLITYFMYLKEREIDRKKNTSALLVKDTDLFISQCEEIISDIDKLEDNVNNAIKQMGFLRQQCAVRESILYFQSEVSTINEREIPVVNNNFRDDTLDKINKIVDKSLDSVEESQNSIEIQDKAQDVINQLIPVKRALKNELVNSRKEQLKAKVMILD